MFEVWGQIHGHGRPIGVYDRIEDAIAVRSMMTAIDGDGRPAFEGCYFRIWDVERGCFVHPDSELELVEQGML
jgi:hypothetical protein